MRRDLQEAGKAIRCKADERLKGRCKTSLKLQGWAKKVLMKLRVCPRAPSARS